MGKPKIAHINMLVPVTITYDTEKGMREGIADVKRELNINMHSCGVNGTTIVNTGRPRQLKKEQNNDTR